MISYLLNTIICSGYLIMIYLLLLQRHKMHRFNRFYLIGSLLFSLTVPLLHFEINTPDAPLPELAYSFNDKLVDTVAVQPVVHETTVSYSQLLLLFYALITVILLIRFSRNIYLLTRLIKISHSISSNDARFVLTPLPVFIHSFLNYIFIDKKKLLIVSFPNSHE